MRGQRALLLMMLTLLAYAGAVSGALTGADSSRAVWRNSSVVFTVTVEDPGIDPLAPESHPIVFSVHQAPEHGIVAGDFSQIIYMSPSSAMLVLSYTPVVGYVGADQVVLKAENPIGESVLISVSLDVVSPESVSSLGGLFSVSTTIDVQTGSFTAAQVVGSVEYSLHATRFVMGYRLKRDTPADDLFDDLYFTFHSPLGSFTTVSGRLEFDPAGSTSLFRQAQIRAIVKAGSLTMTGTAGTDGSLDGTSFTLSLSGRTANGLSLAASAALSPCNSLFKSATLSARYDALECGSDNCSINLTASAGISCDGFEKLTISAAGLHLPDVPLLHFAGTASMTITYELDEKSVNFSPSLASTWIETLCFRMRIARDPSKQGVIEFRSLHVDHTFVGGVRLRMNTSLDPYDLSLNQLVTGHMDYWEKDTLSGGFTYCEGIGGSWELATYFARPGVGNTLFSWGMTELNVDVFCHQVWKFFTKITFRSGVFGGATCELLLGAQFMW